MQLDENSVAEFADEKGNIYALCVFEKGQAKYSLMKKGAWENLDQLQAILADTSLTDEERAAAIKQLVN